MSSTVSSIRTAPPPRLRWGQVCWGTESRPGHQTRWLSVEDTLPAGAQSPRLWKGLEVTTFAQLRRKRQALDSPVH